MMTFFDGEGDDMGGSGGDMGGEPAAPATPEAPAAPEMPEEKTGGTEDDAMGGDSTGM